MKESEQVVLSRGQAVSLGYSVRRRKEAPDGDAEVGNCLEFFRGWPRHVSPHESFGTRNNLVHCSDKRSVAEQQRSKGTAMQARLKQLIPFFAVVMAAGTAAAVALARTAVVPENLIEPSLTGTAKVGSVLTAAKGAWANDPTSFVYKWQRCGTDGRGCTKDVQASSKSTYTIKAGDVGHTIRVVVTASNADGRSDAAPSAASDVVSSKTGPKATVAPAISGTATAGEQLTVSAGTWSPTAVSLAYQWQRCDAKDINCLNILLAKQSTYTVRFSDVGSVLRVLVTAKASTGQTSTYTNYTEFVQSDVTPPTTNQAPRLTFISLIRIGRRVYARFRVCDDGLGRITVVERDQKAGKLAYTRRYSVYTYASCGTFSRSWTPAPRFRTRGRMTVTLQAIDKSGSKSTTRSKNVYRRF